MAVRESDEAFRERARNWYHRRWIFAVAVALAVLVCSGGETLLITNAVTAPISTKIDTNSVSIAVIQALDQSNTLIAQQTAAAQKQQEQVFNNVLVKFFAMQAYLCRAAVAHNATLGGPPAPAGICDVTLSPNP